MRYDEAKGLVWRLPLVRAADVGKLGPAFGLGMGCGVGVGVGIVGGAGLGFGFPGLQLGVGLGVGCGVGVGFGYGLGKGRAYDENGGHSNLGKVRVRKNGAVSGSEVGAILDDFVSEIKRALETLDKGSDGRPRL
ncbi:hypothetical protein O6H91_11G101100 [Diphasiastrum complanatum]|uniref:Uncharacterized protein n=1 Tax=Diphasiastrum complanatum TaxID=34168 RepID=A0ACC2CCD1_DIPCM|nr:hypothetical protein O6H91_11G101100 [Diphasiastrum complanatum]